MSDLRYLCLFVHSVVQHIQNFQENPYYGAVIKRKSGICQMKILY
jgi:hypothetical protein